MKIFSLIILLFSIVGNTQGQNLITGVVTAKDSNQPISGVLVKVGGKSHQVLTDSVGGYSIEAISGDKLSFIFLGYEIKEVKVGKMNKIDVQLNPEVRHIEEVSVVAYGTAAKRNITGSAVQIRGMASVGYAPPGNSESYASVKENKFLSPSKDPLSTFAADVDAASYSNIRRMLNAGRLPEKDAVRVEEMINYFHYALDAPTNGDPVRIYSELTSSPWNKDHQLLRIALKAKDIPKENLASSNLVFLIDVSGSMFGENRLPLVKSSLKMLVDQLRPTDKVSIVTYAGSAGIKLESTSGDQKMKIKLAIDELEAGGSTAGGAGLKMAYALARQNFIQSGNNRIIMASDGDFNVGVSSDKEMESLIGTESKSGISLTVLGFGMGNLKDSKMEILANKGHGNYAYIDNISEARKAMVTEFGATLFTVAKDVKIQVEFNPGTVQAYRLVGYENRLLDAEDFNNDAKMGGDMGVGHVVTALYEIVPVGVKSSAVGLVDDLKYQENKKVKPSDNATEIATIKFRYKNPEDDKSQLQSLVVENKVKSFDQISQDFQFATAVAELGMLLRDSDFKQNSNYDSLIKRAKEAKGKDEEGYRAEFIRLAENAKSITQSEQLTLK
ncbi:YfbK domain-containing protein [Sphingobacterium hungaricum]|nr:von Willebrand factor type A domain-containing protein [Sphingobacterium hungaricum]